jgi:hypothetical protein
MPHLCAGPEHRLMPVAQACSCAHQLAGIQRPQLPPRCQLHRTLRQRLKKRRAAVLEGGKAPGRQRSQGCRQVRRTMQQLHGG